MSLTVTMIAQAITFFVFMLFCAKFIWPPLTRAIEARQKTIADGLAAAERGKLELDESAKRTAQMLREAKQQTQDILAQADRRAAQIIEEAKSAAKGEGERILAGAKAEIEQEISRAREMLRSQVAALAVAGAEQILRREVDARTHADLVAALQRQL